MSFSINSTENITPGSNLNHPTFSDLVNNYVYYHMVMDNKDAKLWKNIPPLYSNYQPIENVAADIIQNAKEYVKGGSITLRIPVSKLYTCDANLHFTEGTASPTKIGYDRLYKIDEIKRKSKQFMKAKDGFSPNSEILHAMVRWIYDDNGNVVGFALCKDRGNLRSFMALSSNAGNDVEVCVTLDFHDVNANMSIDDIIAIEAEIFTEDGIDRRGLDQKTRFRAGYTAKRKKQVAQKEWIDKNLKVDFGNVINSERLLNGLKPHPHELSSLEKLDFSEEGQPGGYISKYGSENIILAVNLMKEIMSERKDTGQIVISGVNSLAKAFYFLSSTPETLGKVSNYFTKGIATKDEIFDALKWIYCQVKPQRRANVPVKFVKDITDLYKGNEKDTTLLGVLAFLPDLLEDLKETKGKQNNYTVSHPCVEAYLDRIRETHMRTEAVNRLTKYLNA